MVATQTIPLQCRIMMPMASVVAFDAAMIRSPSFSRRSSSVTITILPSAMSATADSTESKGGGWDEGIPSKSPRRSHLSIRGHPRPKPGFRR